MLDAVRAAKPLKRHSLANQTVVWCHSQGGHAALWTGALAPTYAPDINLIAVAALAPASDLTGLVSSLPTARCLSGPEVFVSILSALGLARDPNIFSRDPTTGAFGQRLRENIPSGAIQAPLLIAQGLTDPLVLPSVQERYAAGRCAAGQSLEYRTYAGRDRVGLVASDSPLIPDLVSWTQARLAGDPATPNCTSLSST